MLSTNKTNLIHAEAANYTIEIIAGEKKKQKLLENGEIESPTFRMQSGRSTTELIPRPL